MMTEEQEAKLRCLELAAKFADRANQTVVLDTAEKFWSFIKSADPKPPAAESAVRAQTHDAALKMIADSPARGEDR